MGDNTTRLDCRWCETLVQHPLRDHDVGFGKRFVDSGIVEAARGDAGAARNTANGNVVREGRMDDRRLPGHRKLGIDHRGKGIVVNDDQVHSISSHVTVARDDDGDRFADVSDDVNGDRSVLWRGERRGDRHGPDELGDIGAGEDCFDALHRLRRARVDRQDAAVRDLATLERQVLHADNLDVVDVGGAPLDQTWILAAFDSLAYELWQHRRYSHGLPLVRGVLDGVDDVLVTRAAAEVPYDALANFPLIRRGILAQKADRRHDHARRAVAALKTVFLPEAFLQRMKLAVLRQPFDGRHLGAVGLDGEYRAGFRAATIDKDCAGAALTGVAPNVCARQVEMLSQKMDEQQSGLDACLADPAIDRDRDRDHSSLLFEMERIAYFRTDMEEVMN